MIKRFKKGAASFYIVAFSTLILMIVAISFAAVIISEVERTSNDDLSQSAYDSALAGIEDAKLAYYNYLNCKSNNSASDCNTIITAMETNYSSTEEECNMIWTMLNRTENIGSVIESNTASNNMQQVTTCVTMTDELKNYMGTLTPSKMVDVIRPKFGEGDMTISAGDIDRVVLRWYSRDDVARSGVRFNSSTNKLKFPAAATPSIAPPILSFTLLQTGPDFTMDSFNDVNVGASKTNRGMVYLMPSDGSGVNEISKADLVKSNDKTVGDNAGNNPFLIKCDRTKDYVCDVEIKLPEPIGDVRNNDTFEIVVSMPYGQPSTDFMLEFYCGKDTPCWTKKESSGTEEDGEEEGSTEDENTPVTLKGVQLEVDSTGRANDLYRRVITRLKSKDDLALSVMGPLELLGNGKEDGLRKDLKVITEYNFMP